MKSHKGALLAMALVALPAAALAQEQINDKANAVAAQAEELAQEANQLSNAVADERSAANDELLNGTDRVGDHENDGDEGKWGLLGLLGLAGLLGLRRRDPDTHIDRGTRPIRTDADDSRNRL